VGGRCKGILANRGEDAPEFEQLKKRRKWCTNYPPPLHPPTVPTFPWQKSRRIQAKSLLPRGSRIASRSKESEGKGGSFISSGVIALASINSRGICSPEDFERVTLVKCDHPRRWLLLLLLLLLLLNRLRLLLLPLLRRQTNEIDLLRYFEFPPPPSRRVRALHLSLSYTRKHSCRGRGKVSVGTGVCEWRGASRGCAPARFSRLFLALGILENRAAAVAGGRR
jgi:hypothetical protein